MPVVELEGVSKDYRRASQVLTALAGVSFTAEAGEYVSIMGPSGAGKSTLLHLMGGLDAATEGVVRIDEAELGSLGEEALSAFRRRRLGFVFQFFNLLPTLSAWENVALPRLLDGVPLGRSRTRAEARPGGAEPPAPARAPPAQRTVSRRHRRRHGPAGGGGVPVGVAHRIRRQGRGTGRAGRRPSGRDHRQRLRRAPVLRRSGHP